MEGRAEALVAEVRVFIFPRLYPSPSPLSSTLLAPSPVPALVSLLSLVPPLLVVAVPRVVASPSYAVLGHSTRPQVMLYTVAGVPAVGHCTTS